MIVNFSQNFHASIQNLMNAIYELCALYTSIGFICCKLQTTKERCNPTFVLQKSCCKMFVETQRINYSLIKSIKSLKNCTVNFHCILIMIYHLITKEMQNVQLIYRKKLETIILKVHIILFFSCNRTQAKDFDVTLWIMLFM